MEPVRAIQRAVDLDYGVVRVAPLVRQGRRARLSFMLRFRRARRLTRAVRDEVDAEAVERRRLRLLVRTVCRRGPSTSTRPTPARRVHPTGMAGWKDLRSVYRRFDEVFNTD